MNYQRVIPRDLFNESKLLKCMGQLALLIHDGEINLKIEHNGQPFEIRQRQEDGGLYIENLKITTHQQELTLYTSYNSKENYPLLHMTPDNQEIQVFNNDGTLTNEFKETI